MISHCEREVKGAALLGLRLYPNAPPVALNHPFADRETNARSGVLCLAMQALEDLEDALGKLGFNPNAVVLKRKEPLIPAFHRGNMNTWRFIAVVFNAIAERNKLRSGRQSWQGISCHGRSTLFNARRQVGHCALEDVRKICRFNQISLRRNSGLYKQAHNVCKPSLAPFFTLGG